ncbi:hypothetical protein NOCARDAX2BIS_540016 [Nocardioides sp. AX2bis]|nr:hypothetical protein NOCARDAX2BIS_540016 [Nocardioides sp. AX2bis]
MPRRVPFHPLNEQSLTAGPQHQRGPRRLLSTVTRPRGVWTTARPPA